MTAPSRVSCATDGASRGAGCTRCRRAVVHRASREKDDADGVRARGSARIFAIVQSEDHREQRAR
ncbi:Hypothetical protein A7982_10008 [Minicystis rosea]|nr:Hypothetical protein A7982_10008 [Minicystis rosea]